MTRQIVTVNAILNIRGFRFRFQILKGDRRPRGHIGTYHTWEGDINVQRHLKAVRPQGERFTYMQL